LFFTYDLMFDRPRKSTSMYLGIQPGTLKNKSISATDGWALNFDIEELMVGTYYSDLTFWPLAVTLTLGVWTCGGTYAAHCLVMIHTSTKFHQIMFSGSEVMVRTSITRIWPLHWPWPWGRDLCMVSDTLPKSWYIYTHLWSFIEYYSAVQKLWSRQA